MKIGSIGNIIDVTVHVLVPDQGPEKAKEIYMWVYNTARGLVQTDAFTCSEPQ